MLFFKRKEIVICDKCSEIDKCKNKPIKKLFQCETLFNEIFETVGYDSPSAPNYEVSVRALDSLNRVLKRKLKKIGPPPTGVEDKQNKTLYTIF